MRSDLRLAKRRVGCSRRQSSALNALPGAADDPLEREADQIADRVVARLGAVSVAMSAEAIALMQSMLPRLNCYE